MRPITLIMEAFGPFSNQEVIHFDQFKDKGIFLITGPTGAGKTTIFDALIYALYGVSSGDQRDGDGFRSDHAKPEQMTSVTLTFELKGKFYKVRRIPKQMRPKLSGEGLTVQMTDAELEGDEIVLSGVKDVNEKIIDLFGLNAEQFRQIMMIPQGEFRRLILSDSKEKSEIFRKLFGTALFERIQDKMKLEEDVLKNQHFETISQVKALIGQLSLSDESSSLREDCIENPVLPNFKKLVEHVNGILSKNEQECEVLKLQIDKDVKLQDHMKIEIERQNQLNIQLEKLEQYKVKLSDHLKDEAKIEQIQMKLKSAQRAESIRLEAQSSTEKQKVYHERHQAYENLTDQLKKHESEYQLSKEAFEEIPKLKATHEKSQNELMKLNLMSEDVKASEVFKERLGVLQREIEDYTHQKEQYILSIETEKQMNTDLLGRLAILQESKLKLAELSGQKATLNHAVKVFNECISRERVLGEDQNVYAEKQKTVKKLLDQVVFARSACHELEEQFMKGYSGILAKALKDKSPCPVCGSYDHPSPASEQEIVSKADLDASRQDLEQYTSQLEKTKAEVASLRTRIENERSAVDDLWLQLADQMNELLGETLVVGQKSEFKSKLMHFKVELSENENKLRQVVKDEALLLNQRETQEKNLEVYTRNQKELEEKLNTCYLERENLNSKMEQIVLKVPKQLGGYTSLKVEIERLERDVNFLATKIQMISDAYATSRETMNMFAEKKKLASGEKERAHEAFKEAEQLLQQALKKNQFDSFEHYKEARLDELEVQHLVAQVETFQSQKQDLEKTIHAQSALLEDKQRLDIHKLEQELEELNHVIVDQRQNINQMLSSISHNQKLISEINQKLDHLVTLDSKYAYVSKLARMARGQNAQKLSFENFVLSQYFEDVLDAANVRLQKMTTGRFELIRKREKSKGNVQSGLDIEVMDQYTGKLRHVKTLSGGETFKASLSLALGLSDIVQRFSGGISLETMFIDEGFGTLDSDSLDRAIESLMSLGHHSRLVGIISHVQELKERIPAQLMVVQKIEGSHTEVLL